MSTVTVSDVTNRPLAQELEQIFREHYQLVYRTACRVTGNAEDAADVLQTIFLRLLRREFPYDLKKNPKAYLYRAAVNSSLDTIRSRQRRALTYAGERLADRACGDESRCGEEMHQRLLGAIAELS